MDSLLGQTIDRYRIVELLGEGAFGRVYRASHQVLHRDVALKVLSSDFNSDRSFAIRFRREAEMASRVQHQHVVQVIDFGATADGRSFLVMELVRGGTLAELLKKGPLDSARIAQLLSQIAHGLAAIHEHGLVHRDLKPSNIIVTADGEHHTAKIMDFGIARAEGSENNSAEKLTQTGCMIGTPLYMAPEQAYSSRVDSKADMYALGVIAYEMITGSPPFIGEPAQVLMQRIAHAPPPLETSTGLEALVMALLAREPQHRPDARMVIAQLDAIAESPQPIASEPPAARTYTDDVQFTVYRPKMIEPDKWYPLLAFAHLGEARSVGAPDPIEEVKRQAEQALGESASDYRSSSQDSRLPVPAEGELTFVPDVPGVQFNPRRRSFVWLEDVHREEFRIKATRDLAGNVARGRLVVMLGHVMIAEVPIALRVEGSVASAEQELVSARTFRRIYACYAPEDRPIAEQIARYAQVLGDRLLSSGIAAIAGADVFQLFWSERALGSQPVLDELAHAMALGRTDFIRPVHWEVPIPRDPARNLPPQELMALPWTCISASSAAGEAAVTVEDGGHDTTISRTRTDAAVSRVTEPPRTRTLRIGALASGIAGVLVAVTSAALLFRTSDQPRVIRDPINTSVGVEHEHPRETRPHSERPHRRASPVAIASNPSGATVYLDGVRLASTPVDLTNLDEGSVYEIVLALPGHAPLLTWVVGGKDEGTRTLTLEPGSADDRSPVERARLAMVDQLAQRAQARLKAAGEQKKLERLLLQIEIVRQKPGDARASHRLYELETSVHNLEW